MKKALCGWILILLCINLTGCWDVQDITNRAYITGIGLDKGEKDNESKVTFEIVLPTLLRGAGDRKANFIHTLDAPSIGSAIEKLQAHVSRPLNLGHIRVLVMGESLAKEKNFLDIADFFQRSPNIQRRIRLLVVQNAEAKDMLETKPVFERYVAKELVDMTQVDYSLVRAKSFFEFVGDLREHDGRGFIARGIPSEKGNIAILNGAGIYNHWRLVGWLSSEETRNANWLMEEEQFIVDAKQGESLYTYMVDKKTVSIKPIEENGDIRFNVTIKTTGPLMQKQGEQIDVSDPKVLQRLEKLFATTIKDQTESAIAKAQMDFRVDYLGFDTALKRANKSRYERLAWNEVFPGLPITVEVDAKINRFGLSK